MEINFVDGQYDTHTLDLLMVKQACGCQKDMKEHMAQMDFI